MFQALLSASAAWPMRFTAVPYLLFLPLAIGGYFLLRGTARKAWLLLASYFFYVFAAPRYFVVLLCGTAFCYMMGVLIEKTQKDKNRRTLGIFSVLLLIVGLCFFKYNDFFAAGLAPLFAQMGLEYTADYFVAASALGISFYTFTGIAYLVDVWRKDVTAEKNILDFALFMGFFGTVTMGPICRASELMPQVKDTTRRFQPEKAGEALVLLGIGFFKKIAVADTLKIVVDAVYSDLEAYSGASLTLAAVLFTIQLYFDFSGYTDIVRGSAKLLGINLPHNFQNPYFATNFSLFWSKWHISLSRFLQDYIFMPLVWSRWTEKLPIVGKYLQKPPMLSSIAITFLISGIWHGDTLPFLVWGALQAVFRIGEECMHRYIGKPKKRPPFWVKFGKTAVVLILWTESLVFFRVGMQSQSSVSAAVSALVRQFTPVSLGTVWQDVLSAVQNGFYSDTRIAMAFIAFSLMCTALALWADWWQAHRLKGKSLAVAFSGMVTWRRWVVYFIMAMCCFAGFLAQSGGFGAASFLYGGF